MAFEVVKITRGPDGALRFGQRAKVKLSGPGGPLARHALSCAVAADGCWVLTGPEFAAALAPEPGGGWELLLSSGDGTMRLVCQIAGCTGDFATDVVLRGICLEPAGDGHWRATGREAAEALQLRGGRLAPKAAWAWAPPKMSIGSAFLSPEAFSKTHTTTNQTQTP